MADLVINSIRFARHSTWSPCCLSKLKTLYKLSSHGQCVRELGSAYTTCRRFYGSPPPSSPNTTGQSITNDSCLVYSGSMAPMIKRLKFVSLATSTLGLAMQPPMYRALSKPASSTSVSIGLGALAVTTSLIILSPLLVNLLTKRYVTHLYFDEESRSFTIISLNFFNRKKLRTFKADDVQVPLSTGPFTTFLVDGQPYFVDGLEFSDINIYNHLMGYDKLDEKMERMVKESSKDGGS